MRRRAFLKGAMALPVLLVPGRRVWQDRATGQQEARDLSGGVVDGTRGRINGIDAETELVAGISQEIALELDRDILNQLFAAIDVSVNVNDCVLPARLRFDFRVDEVA